MMLHLMYKALIEMSPTREEFLSRLFSRPPPARMATNALGGRAARRLRPSPSRMLVAFERNRTDIYDWLQRRHGFTLSRADLGGIDYVYRAFYSAGPELRYSFGRGAGWQPFPTYRDLMVADDGQGVQRGYLASEELYQTLRDMHERNLIVPLVGDFGGPKALRSVARYLDVHHATVSVFYTSNVEQYPLPCAAADAWQRFYDNVGGDADHARRACSSARSSTTRDASCDPRSAERRPADRPAARRRCSIRSRSCSAPIPRATSATTTTSSSLSTLKRRPHRAEFRRSKDHSTSICERTR